VLIVTSKSKRRDSPAGLPFANFNQVRINRDHPLYAGLVLATFPRGNDYHNLLSGGMIGDPTPHITNTPRGLWPWHNNGSGSPTTAVTMGLGYVSSTNFSIAAWAKQTTAAYAAIATIATSPSSNDYYNLRITDGGAANFMARNTNHYSLSQSSTTTAPLNSLNHYAAVGGSVHPVYLNGGGKSTNNSLVTGSYGIDELYIGAYRNRYGTKYQPAGNAAVGPICIWSGRQLTDIEVRYLANFETAGALYEEDTSNKVYSYTSSGVTGDVTITPGAGSFGYAGQDPSISQSTIYAVGAGGYSYIGQTPGVVQATVVDISEGEYTYAGQDPSVVQATIITPDEGQYDYEGQVPVVSQSDTVTPGAGSYGYVGKAVTLGVAVLIEVATGSYRYAGQAVQATSGAWKMVMAVLRRRKRL